MSLLVKPHPPADDGTLLDVTPESAGWGHVGFRAVRLVAGQAHVGGEPGREACLVLLSGTADVRAGALHCAGIGGRAGVFVDAPPAAVYVPAGTSFTVAAISDVELAVCTAPGDATLPPRLIDPATMSREVRGSGTNQRFVRNILPESEPAESLLVVEVITPGGNWSSYPPHKHDRDAPGEETALEETYYHRLDPPQGFAFQRVYTDARDLDETITVGDGEVVMVPRGYHPVAAPHGYNLYYLNVMAGPKRQWIFKNDPAHAWIAATV
ncbi:5-deoxy-glucuronate isomerase [Hephaestia sp. GCM10023244]|uniref:5-deoxy-glucuronate isomerase n=1 Tax=unclassified Hephaestia TaxID=2631281 RepID=UPI0020777DB6|nr:5-deoxy-glucuronate isomerase [Hephaestia sp. MAHUQ-44]MCM8731525.1 5-deoxy-glucuronate isomerase [Hephaestia sp. MAHUQ-44]